VRGSFLDDCSFYFSLFTALFVSTVDKFCIDWVAGTSSSHPLLSILLVGERKSKAISSLKLNIILPRN
jgi:hypothetical protein